MNEVPVKELKHQYTNNLELMEQDVKWLMSDHRFIAVFALLDSMRNEQIDWSSAPKYADLPGQQNHALGTINGIISVECRLSEIFYKQLAEDDDN
jgi:hypothetical protein